MPVEMIRTFHPVGQGAFYSEQWRWSDGRFNVVYDCGTKEAVQKVQDVVSSAFEDGVDIDVLFISHFDSDHVSLLPLLKSKHKIKKVVLPLLHKNQRLFLLGFYRATLDDASEELLRMIELLINDPAIFFDDAEIVYVRSTDDIEGEERMVRDAVGPRDEDYYHPENVRHDSRRSRYSYHNSFEKLEVGSDSPFAYWWSYVPYNYDFFRRQGRFLKKLTKWLDDNGFKMDDMANPDFVINHRRDLKKNVYGGGRTINENSLVVYSGFDREQCRFVRDRSKNAHGWLRSGCVYTGDSDLNKSKIETAFASYWDFVGTVQVPHHGAKGSFNKSFMRNHRLRCPISVGPAGARHGHPHSTVIRQIGAAGCWPILVTEKPDSKYSETLFPPFRALFYDLI